MKTGPLALGTRIHGALDAHYSTGIDLLEAHAALVEEDRKIIISNLKDTYELDTEADLGRIMLEGYPDWMAENGIDSDLELISTEEKISMPMFGGEVELQGKLDMRVRRRTDGVRLFRDFKTVGTSLTEFAATASMSEQMLTYMILEASQADEAERSEGGLFTLLRKVKRTATAKPPFYDQIEVRHNIFTLRSFWNRIHGTVMDMMRVRTALDAGEAHSSVAYPTPTRDCKWKCTFYSICTMFDDGSAVEEAVSDMYKERDPYAYYNTERKGSE